LFLPFIVLSLRKKASLHFHKAEPTLAQELWVIPLRGGSGASGTPGGLDGVQHPRGQSGPGSEEQDERDAGRETPVAPGSAWARRPSCSSRGLVVVEIPCF